MKKRMRPSPALVISLVALFVALGGTSYAAINALPKNSVGTKQLKNGAVTAAKLNATALAHYLKYGRTLPSGMTEVGDWGFGTSANTSSQPVASFAVPLAHGLDASHRIYVSGASATYCPGVGHAAAGYLCVYAGAQSNAATPDSGNIFNPETGDGPGGTGAYGFSILIGPAISGAWYMMGTYAVTAP